MGLIRTLGLAALAALATLVLVGASPASVNTPTQLCKVHTSLACSGQATTEIHMLNEGVGTLLNNLADVLCLTVLVNNTPLTSGKPQQVHSSGLIFQNCGTTSSHNNCAVTVEEEPLFNLLKTGLDKGVATGTNGRFRVKCEDIFGFIAIDCKYDFNEVEFPVGTQHLTANETPIEFVAGSELCPEESTLDGLLKSLTAAYILKGPNPPNVALCKVHSSSCAEKDLVKSLHMVTSKPPVLYNGIANIQCESSLGNATVLGLAEVQKVDVTELAWNECHTQGAADNCIVTSKSLPTLDLSRTALNLGDATTLGLKIGIDCTILGLIELDCVYGNEVTLHAEGALHKEGSGHGMVTANKVILKKLEGSGHCPESVKWDALYEPLEHVYIVE